MGRIKHENTIEVPIDTVWDYMSEVSNLPDWMFGLSEMTPLTDQTRGEGARFQLRMKVGARIDSVLTVTRWVDGQYALGKPELGLSNWQFGRLFGRGGVLSGDSVFTVRTRVTQTDAAVHR